MLQGHAQGFYVPMSSATEPHCQRCHYKSRFINDFVVKLAGSLMAILRHNNLRKDIYALKHTGRGINILMCCLEILSSLFS